MSFDELSQPWDRDGWLLLEKFFSTSDVERINAVVADLWQEKPRRVTVDDLDLNQRARMSSLTDDQRSHRIKLSDLYLTQEAVRDILLDSGLLELVAQLMGNAPVLCNSLNLERSSSQAYHADSLYMTPKTPAHLVACWVALEDVVPDSGPLQLYSGSHRFSPFIFSDGTRHVIEEELPRWANHMRDQLHEHGLKPQQVYAEAGDVVLWHGDLLHGAEEIRDNRLTRRSMVAHYFSTVDCKSRGGKLIKRGNGYWLKRQPQPVDLSSRVMAGLERRWWRVWALANSFRGLR